MTESDWQGDMLRRMQAQQPPAGEPDPAESPQPAQPQAEPAPQQPPPQQPPPPQQYEQQPYQQQPPPQQYPPNQYPPQEYPPQEYYPPQGYQQQPPPYQPGPYDQQYAPPPPPPPYEQYPPPYEQYPPYEQQYPPAPDAAWGPPPTPQSDQIGTPLPPEQEGESVFRRFRKIASEAAYLVGASGRMQRDVDDIATIRRPIAIMRRIGVLSPVLNAGTSTVTALLSTMLAAQRSDGVVAVDVDPNGAELSRRLEQTVGSGPVEGVRLVRSDPDPDSLRSTLAQAQLEGTRNVGLAVVDCPDTMFDPISSAMASSGHCAVIVIPSVDHVANYCLQQLDQLTQAGQDVLLSRGVVVISLVQNVDPRSVGWLASAFRQRGLEPVLLPYDAHIAQSWPLYSEQLQAETRRAVLDLAARVVETVTRAVS
ncbi:hypothetical protein AB0L70_06375 [Kribbella sp. NPDC051952]|uniref:MinD/ParA family ATP-binding protein n=1 Tax=Kribbella sp. NPDC051952 TaxID=3154851 RepID=UPI00343E7688